MDKWNETDYSLICSTLIVVWWKTPNSSCDMEFSGAGTSKKASVSFGHHQALCLKAFSVTLQVA